MATRMPSSDHVPWRVLMVTPSGYVEVVEVCAPDEATALDTARHWKPCHEVATDPSGKPLIWGRLGRTPVLGLPGNPVSALVCGVVFLIPAIARLSGLPGDPPPTRRVITAVPIAENDRRADHLRSAISYDSEGRMRVTPAAVQDSSMLATLARADALVLRAPLARALPAGAEVEAIILADLGV